MRTNVFLDSGLIFALLGVGSSDRSDVFKQLLSDMKSPGMCVMIFDHTFDEIYGIVENSIKWIGNIDYDPSLASETAFYIINNNWSVNKVRSFLVGLQETLQNNYGIQIKETIYPEVSSISFPYEADLVNKIEESYVLSKRHLGKKSNKLTIEYDAKSLFFTKHYNQNKNAKGLANIKNIFITTNRTLAKIGTDLLLDNEMSNGVKFPICMTDITWGGLVWANNPTKISTFNKAKVLSAAYVACLPSDRLLEKLNKSLMEQLEKDNITAEHCYL